MNVHGVPDTEKYDITKSSLVYVSKLINLLVCLVHHGHDCLCPWLIRVNSAYGHTVLIASSVYPHKVETED